MADMLQNLVQEYKKAVSQNSAVIAQFESGFRFISYAIAGRFEDSTLLSELLYSASNLLVLFNDAIIQKACGILPNVSSYKERLESLVTVLEYVGVFVELAARRLYGEVGRWTAIAVLQLAKSVCRFLLLVKLNTGIQTVPPISPIDRETVIKEAISTKQKATEKEKGKTGIAEGANGSVTFTLKRSGKVMRTISTAPSLVRRDWKIPVHEPAAPLPKPVKWNHKSTKLSRTQIWGECLYIFKPLIHLSGLYICGRTSFKPWILSAGLDVGSLCMLGETHSMNAQEKSEVRRRALMLAMYFLRSPLYDRYTKQGLLRILRDLADNIPGLSIIIIPIMEYLPVWQRIYFYTWSS